MIIEDSYSTVGTTEPALGEQSRSELVNAQSPMTDRPAELRMKIVVRLRKDPNKEHLVQILAYAASQITPSTRCP